MVEASISDLCFAMSDDALERVMDRVELVDKDALDMIPAQHLSGEALSGHFDDLFEVAR